MSLSAANSASMNGDSSVIIVIRLKNESDGRVVWKMEVLRVKEEKNVVRTVKRRRTDWIDHILRKNCLLRHVIEGKIEGTGRRGRIRKQLLVDIKELRGCWKLKEKTLDRALWRACF